MMTARMVAGLSIRVSFGIMVVDFRVSKLLRSD